MLDQTLWWGFNESYESACTSLTRRLITYHTLRQFCWRHTQTAEAKFGESDEGTINLVGGKVGREILKKTAALPSYAKYYTYIMESVGRKLWQPVAVQVWMRPPHTSLLLFTNTLYLQTQRDQTLWNTCKIKHFRIFPEPVTCNAVFLTDHQVLRQRSLTSIFMFAPCINDKHFISQLIHNICVDTTKIIK